MKGDISEVMPVREQKPLVKEVVDSVRNLSEVCPSGPVFKNESEQRDKKTVYLKD